MASFKTGDYDAYNDDDYKCVIEFLRQKRINTELFISDIILLDDIEEKGFKRLLSGTKGIKVLVKPWNSSAT